MGRGSGILLNSQQATGWPPTKKNYSVQNANSVKVENPWIRQLQIGSDLAKKTELSTEKTESNKIKCNGMDLQKHKRTLSLFPQATWGSFRTHRREGGSLNLGHSLQNGPLKIG